MAPPGQHIHATGGILDRLGELKDYPNQELAPYEEFWADGRTYYFTPGGSLYRKDPENEGADRIFGHNFDTVFEEEGLATIETGAKKPVRAGLLSGLESQGEMNELLEELFGSPVSKPAGEVWGYKAGHG